jgi:Uncharacterized protein conserved in bacteria (DUF2191).
MTWTVMDLDHALLAAVAEIFGTTTEVATVNAALEDAVKRSKRAFFLNRLAEGGLPDLTDSLSGWWPHPGRTGATPGSEAAPPLHEHMTVREEAHRLLEAVPEDRLPDAIELLRQWTDVEHGEDHGRRFRTTAIFDGEPDLGERAKAIVRDVWTGQEPRSA